MVDRQLKLEALSALLGRPVKHRKTFPSQAMPSDISPFLYNFELQSDIIGGKPTSLADRETAATAADRGPELFVDLDDVFDPRYDKDFTHIQDGGARFSRGGERYSRPYGCMRYGLKALGKYEDGDGWLGDGVDAWPVSYHGTDMEAAKAIMRGYYKAGPRQVHGRGIYSTPDLKVALQYSKRFTSEETKKTYDVILQNRINKRNRKIPCENYWLVPIPEGTSPEKEKEISMKSIRPYGFLLREVK